MWLYICYGCPLALKGSLSYEVLQICTRGHICIQKCTTQMLFLHNRTPCSHKRTCPAGSIWNRAIKYETVVNCRKWDANGCVKEQSDLMDEDTLLTVAVGGDDLEMMLSRHPKLAQVGLHRDKRWVKTELAEVVVDDNDKDFRLLRQYHVTERDFPSGYIYGAQWYGYVETTLVWYTCVYRYVPRVHICSTSYDNDPFSPIGLPEPKRLQGVIV